MRLAVGLKRNVEEKVGRYGGEEFSVLLVNTDIQECEPMAQRIVDKIHQKTFLKDGIASNITISAGMAGFPTHSDHVKGLIFKSDKAKDLCRGSIWRIYEKDQSGGSIWRN